MRRTMLLFAGLVGALAITYGGVQLIPSTSPTFFAQAHAFAGDGSLPDVAERAVRSVVNISTTKKVGARGPVDSPFFQFFGRPGMPPPTDRSNSLGSGILVSKDGLVLTNNHVVGGADDIRVTLSNGREFRAELVGTDPKSDVAVVRIVGDLGDIEPMPLGDSGRLRLGETVLAIGNPFGLGHTVTMGIVSAKGRGNMGITDYEDFIQTDAAINPGNSGGPLINTRGELVGINTAIVSRSGGYQGIGFAIPSDMAGAIMESLVADGRVSRGWLGVGIQQLSSKLATRLGVPRDTKGVLVSGVVNGTPAAAAGLEAGDVITSIDGEEMANPGQLRNTIAMKGSGTKVDLNVIRKSKAQQFAVKLGELEDERRSQKRVRPKAVGEAALGIVVGPLDQRARRALRLSAQDRGVVVRSVDPGSAAHRAGVRAGDLVVRVNRKRVETPKAFTHRVEKSEGAVLLQVRRGVGSLFILVDRG